MLKVLSPGYDIQACPVENLCSSGLLPLNSSYGLDCDWSQTTFVSISQIVAVLAIQLCGKSSGHLSKIIQSSSDVHQYISRMNYFKILDIDINESFQRHDPQERFMPLSVVPVDEYLADVNSIAANLKCLVTKHVPLDSSAICTLDLSFGEILDNIIQHSRAASPGIAAAQYYAKKQFVEICVADCGIGIAASMAENPAYSNLSKVELVSKAFERNTGQWYKRSVPGTQCVSGGMGLSFSERLTSILGGYIWVVTKNEAICISQQGIKHLESLSYPGTLIIMRLPVSQKKILESDLYSGGDDIPVDWDPSGGNSKDNVLW